MKLVFWGATSFVTGSMTFLDLGETVVIIDCGLQQGSSEEKELNLQGLPYSSTKISDVFITHAHLDHCGYLPKLVKDGFTGVIHCTPPTAKLLKVILTDSAKLDENHLYDLDDVKAALKLVKTREWDEPLELNSLIFTFKASSHILGASSIIVSDHRTGKTLHFSGDLGRYDDPLLPPPQSAPSADVIVMESTYGGKLHPKNLEHDLYRFLETIQSQERVGLIASFAVARGQTLITLIAQYFARYPEKKFRVVVDGPMMKEANEVYQHYAHLTRHPLEVSKALKEIDTIDYEKEWLSLKKKSGPLVIISSSGMLTGGRITRNLENWHHDESAILFLPGYQGEGTPGQEFIHGKRVFHNSKGESFEWKGEVWHSEAFSSHADQSELISWLGEHNKKAQIVLLHGEPSAKAQLKETLHQKGHESVIIPARGEVITIA